MTDDLIETLEMIDAGATGHAVPVQNDPLFHRPDLELQLVFGGFIEPGRKITPAGRALLGRSRVPAP